MACVVHADDFTFEVPPAALKTIAMDMHKFWIIKVRATLGPEAFDDKEVSILNRVVRWTKDCLLYEADPRHVEKLLREAEMGSCKEVIIPGITEVKEASSSSEPAWFERQVKKNDEDPEE